MEKSYYVLALYINFYETMFEIRYDCSQKISFWKRKVENF